MQLLIESADLNEYLAETEELDYSHPAVLELAAKWAGKELTQQQLVKEMFEYVRDRIDHSWDIQSRRVTRKASEAIIHREGICYAKANVLAALLRSAGVPAGFCYQRLTIGDSPETGFCIHALNAVYLTELGKWVRLDARGNKKGVDAQFSTAEEKLAFPVREDIGEVDYKIVFTRPNQGTMETLKKHDDCLLMYRSGLPESL